MNLKTIIIFALSVAASNDDYEQLTINTKKSVKKTEENKNENKHQDKEVKDKNDSEKNTQSKDTQMSFMRWLFRWWPFGQHNTKTEEEPINQQQTQEQNTNSSNNDNQPSTSRTIRRRRRLKSKNRSTKEQFAQEGNSERNKKQKKNSQDQTNQNQTVKPHFICNKCKEKLDANKKHSSDNTDQSSQGEKENSKTTKGAISNSSVAQTAVKTDPIKIVEDYSSEGEEIGCCRLLCLCGEWMFNKIFSIDNNDENSENPVDQSNNERTLTNASPNPNTSANN